MKFRCFRLAWVFLCLFPTSSLLFTINATSFADPVVPLKNQQKVTCKGTNNRLSKPSDLQLHYHKLEDNYRNCTHVEGSLELTWIQEDAHRDLSYLKKIQEVQGYVLIYQFDVENFSLPALEIIHGETLFNLPGQDGRFSLMVTLSRVKYLELPVLRDIMAGDVGIINNFNWCRIESLNWDEILSARTAKFMYTYNFNQPTESSMLECRDYKRGDTCVARCPQDSFVNEDLRECFPCHEACNECNGPNTTHCVSCRKYRVFYNKLEEFNENSTLDCTMTCPPESLIAINMEDAGGDNKTQSVCILPSIADERSTISSIINVGIVFVVVFINIGVVLAMNCRDKWTKSRQKRGSVLRVSGRKDTLETLKNLDRLEDSAF